MDSRGYDEGGQYNLGSMSAMSYAEGANQGDLVADSLGRYLPFGGLRQDSGDQPLDGGGLSDRGFTGHYENRDLGLTYMQARYYDPLLRRFVSADTIIPEPGSSMGYNRYAYVNQNPITFSDPTGHCAFAPPFDTLLCIILLLGLSGDAHRTDAPAILVNNDQVFREVAASRGIDPVVLAAVVLHESGAKERALGDFGEQLLLHTYPDPRTSPDLTQSIGIAQMQIRTAQLLEQKGYISPQAHLGDTIMALFDDATAIDYAGAYLQYIGDEIDAWTNSNGIRLDGDTRNRLMISTYNLGWNDPLGDPDADVYKQLIESDAPGVLIAALANFGYVSQQVFAPNQIALIEKSLGLSYDPQ